MVQDPAEALYPDMPFNALSQVQVDYRVPLSEVAPLLVQLTSEAVEEGEKAVSDEIEIELNFAKQAHHDILDVKRLGEVSPFTCPECHGSLWQMREGGVLRFRCRTGHAYTAQALLADLSTSVETLLWNAVRGLEEKTDLVRHLASHLHQNGQTEASEDFLAQAQVIEQRTNLVRQAFSQNDNKAGIEPKV